jgi:hypothetical protein
MVPVPILGLDDGKLPKEAGYYDSFFKGKEPAGMGRKEFSGDRRRAGGIILSIDEIVVYCSN